MMNAHHVCVAQDALQLPAECGKKIESIQRTSISLYPIHTAFQLLLLEIDTQPIKCSFSTLIFYAYSV